MQLAIPKIPRKHMLFSIMYFCTMLILLLDQLDTAPGTVYLRKIKYVYIGVMFLDWIKRRIESREKKNKICSSNIVFFLLIVHTVLFGYIFTKDNLLDLIYPNAREELIFLIFVFLTLSYVRDHDCILLFVGLTYGAVTCQLGWAAITHLNNFVNPLAFLRVFSSSGRYRASFGFIHYGYTGNFCLLGLITSLCIFDNWRIHGLINKKRTLIKEMCIVDFFIICMMLSSAARSAILSFMMLLIVYITIWGLSGEHLIKYKRQIWIVGVGVALLFLVIGVYGGVFSYIWEGSNRDLNVEINYPAFQKVGNLWTGMGYVDNSRFAHYDETFGVMTSSLDMYYLYIFFTTGVIGSILIGTAIVYMFYRVIRYYKWINQSIFVFSLTVSWLFYAYWQCSLFNYRFLSSMVCMIIIFFYIDQSSYIRYRVRNKNGRS